MRGEIFTDDLSKLRILEPEVREETEQLKEECGRFVDGINHFHHIVASFIEMVQALAQEVEQEKIKAIGNRNLVQSVSKLRECQHQQLSALVAEKQMILERYKLRQEALIKQQNEQKEFIEQFMQQK